MQKGFTLGQIVKNKKALKKFGNKGKGSKEVKGYVCPAK